MDAAKWQQIKSLFDRVVDLSSTERDELLKRQCNDPEIIDEVTALVDAATDRGKIPQQGLNTLVVSGAHQLVFQETGLNVDDQIGVYQVEKLVGQGGMGSVYLANRSDRQFQQKVAIKVSHRTYKNDQQSARFALERQLLGQLEHPYIARIFDAGKTADNCPFIIMEYIEGQDITSYCNNNRLTIEQRIQLFCQVCEAIQYAHQKGIIHRDIKPLNILIAEIEGQPVPKIIDFGIAENQWTPKPEQTQETSLDKTAQADIESTRDTAEYARAGTPVYMSLEQLENFDTLDTRSDLYSLGVLLYVLLSGVSPFKIKEKDFDVLIELKRGKVLSPLDAFLRSDHRSEIAAKRSTSVKKLQKALDREITAIVEKSMSIRPEKRYPTATELTKDLRRYLKAFPVEAIPLSQSYWLRKLIQRNRMPFMFGGIFVVGLLLAIFVSTNAMLEAKEAGKLVELESKKVQVINEYLGQMFAAVDPREKGQEVRVIDVLEQAENDVDEKFSKQPLVRASLLKTFGKSRTGLGHYEKAQILLSKAHTIYLQILGEQHVDTLTTSNLIGELQGELGDHTKALEIFEQALINARENLGEQHRLTMTLINNVAVNSYFIAKASDDDARGKKSLNMMAELLSLRTKVLGEEHPDTSHARNNLASLHSAFDNHKRALELYLKNHEIQTRVFGTSNFYTLTTLSNIAYEHFKLEAFDHAMDYANRSYSGLKQIQGIKHHVTVGSATTLINAQIKNNHFEDAKKILIELKQEFLNTPSRLTWLTKDAEAFARKVLDIKKPEDTKDTTK